MAETGGAISPIIGQVRCVCPDAYAWRVGLEIMSGLTTRGILRFRKGELAIAHANQPRTAAASFCFPEKLLLYYEKRITTGTQHDEVYADFDLTQMVDACKSYDKREEVTITAPIKSDGIISCINLQRGNNAVDAVECGSPSMTQIETYIDIKTHYYRDLKPTAKLITARFSKIISNYKVRGCTNISFVLSAEGVLIKGHRGNTTINITNCNDDSDNDEETPNESDSRTVIKGEGGPDLVIRDYVISIKFREVRDWMNKINRLSPARSVICIYLSTGCPLIIETMIGSVGTATFTFTNEQR